MADITLEERVAYLESLLAARSIEPEDTTTIDELDPVASVYNEDLILVKQNGDEKKATVQNVKDNVMTDVDTKLDNYSTTEEMNEAIEASSPKVSQEPGNVVEMKTDGLFVSEDISGKVESFTQEAYDKLPEAEKNDGKIRELTDAPGNEIPFVILDDTLNTASNVLSAQKVMAEINRRSDYSTEEVNTGMKWVDGRTRYRKVFIDSNNSWSSGDNLIGNIENFKEPISIKAIALNSSLMAWVENNEGGNARCYAYVKPNGDVHFYRYDVSDGSAYPKKVIIEYTKTTD